ncbi:MULTISPECIES: phage tail assembly chaperone [Lysinibacillus]|uniref:phage tail assembly chaperone n=1 Tax=Lysinibacillus TaxID=400634 RepID=UPI0028984413|nr:MULTISPECIES: phage portal protein [Lysinibacillus]MED3799948.1 phage portal protein [Lysinibacillus capsici]
MSNFKAFMKENVRQADPVELKLERFTEPIKLRPLTSAESDLINDRCFKNKPGRKGRQERVFDPVAYNRGISVAAIIYPDLNDTELQKSYGVKGAEQLFGAMFWVGEASQISEKVSEISGLDHALEDEVDEAKN